MSPADMVAEAITRGQRFVKRTYRYATDRPDSTYLSTDELRKLVSPSSPELILARFRDPATLHMAPGLADPSATALCLKTRNRESAEDILREASAVLHHAIPIFGRTVQLELEINWHADPASGVSWPFLHFTRVPIRMGGGADVRVAWELNRLSHLVTLGQAYSISHDERYTEEFIRQISSWYAQNPPRFGVNWMVAMEAAIRSVNLAAALELFRDSSLMESGAIEVILKLVVSHGRFIRANLEFSHYVTSNHYLSDLIGLFVLGALFPEVPESRDWVSYGASELVHEAHRQILPDGVDYEGSTAYHRLIVEIYLCFVVLARQLGVEVPLDQQDSLESMFDFVRHYLRTDGTAPMIGDSDDGRLLRFKSRPAVDHSYLMSLAAVYFANGAFKRSDRLDPEAIWWFGAEGADLFDRLPARLKEPVSKTYPDAQIAIQRAGPLYLIADCGDHGARGHGSHAHSDALSFELFAYGHTFLRDPGTFVYSASELWRNRFRSTAYHNVVEVDGEEISAIRDGQLFALGPNVRPRINRWESSSELDLLDCEHFAYLKLSPPIIHRRIIEFQKDKGFWIIGDEFAAPEGEATGPHLFEFFFNFDAGVRVKLEETHNASAICEDAALAVLPISGHAFESRMTNRWVSLSYGTRSPASGIIYRLYASAPLRNTILLIPHRLGDESKVADIAREVNETQSFYERAPQ
ncbi:MAG: alginate lyase family protein [Blastocatellia bacterium]